MKRVLNKKLFFIRVLPNCSSKNAFPNKLLQKIHFQNCHLKKYIFKIASSKKHFQNCSLKNTFSKSLPQKTTFAKFFKSLLKYIFKIALLKNTFLKNTFSKLLYKKMHLSNLILQKKKQI